jgi:mannose-6-phosphate isomerase-like protein (cupin superfamily)
MDADALFEADHRQARFGKIMKRMRLSLRAGFHVGMTRRSAQVATMVLAPRGSEGGPDNRHRGSDQWLYVVAGIGIAKVNGRRVPLAPGTLILIERGDIHEVRNTGRGNLKTVNMYVPPAYRHDGTPRSRGRPSRRTRPESGSR